MSNRPDAGKIYRVGVSSSAQKAFLNEQGQSAGLYVDVFRTAAARAGVRYRFVWLGKRNVDDALTSGEIDLHVAATHTSGRRQSGFYLAAPWWETPLILVVPHHSPYRRVEDLRAKTVAVPGASKGYWEEFFHNSVPGARRLDAPFPDNPVRAMCQGRADAVLAVGTDAEALLAVHPEGCRETGFRFLRARFQAAKYSVISQQENRSISDLITNEIREMAVDGQLEKIVSPWLGLNSTAATGLGAEIIAQRRTALTLSIAAAIMVAIVSAFLGVLLWLQRRTSSRVAAALERARRGEEAKTQFLATMSHEVRTPLNGVLGMTELMLGTTLNPEQRDAALTIRRSSAALLTVLNDVIDLSRLEAGRIEIARERFGLRAILDDVVTLMAIRAAEKGLCIYVDAAADVPDQMEGDPGRLRQVLLNLVGNAVKFTESGSVQLCVTLAPPGNDRSLKIRFAVADTGPGIPSEGLPLLFRKFSQLDSSAARNHGGAGLGLAISDALVKALGGEISVDSRLGSGSTFSFVLPFPAVDQDPKPLVGRRVGISGPDAAHVRCLRQFAEFAGATIDLSNSAAISVWVERGVGRITRLGENTNVSPPPLILAAPVSYHALIEALRTGYQVPAPKSANHPAEPPQENPLLVLVAEDNLVNRKVLTTLLGRLGCRVIEAHDGHQAVELWRTRRPDLILMDCQMPVMDGYEAARKIRTEEETIGAARSPILAVTANVIKEDRERCIESGMDDILAKPYTFAQLSLAVKAALEPPPAGSLPDPAASLHLEPRQ